MRISIGDLIISENVTVADRFMTRLKGWLGKKSLKANDETLLIVPCSSVHTFGMHFKIDVIFLDDKNLILHMIESMKPNRTSAIVPKAKKVLELPEGQISRSKLRLLDQIRFED
ncbi:MAG TPA: DUF192 domain-containing protein [Bacilli bacterium]